MNDEPFNDLLAMLRQHQNAVDEMAFFSSPIHPVLPFETVKAWAPILKRRMEQARKAGYRAGIKIPIS